jgi:type II secretory pathway predicted ATPase ExeA
VELAGRGDDQELFATAMERIALGLDARPMAFYGLRGVGKTVLLRAMLTKARNAGWMTAFIEADPDKDLRVLLSDELEDVIASLAKPGATQMALAAIKTALGFVRMDFSTDGGMSLGLDLSGINSANAATGNIAGDLNRLVRELAKATVKSKTGVAIFIDEAQELSSDDIKAVNILAHRASQESYRLALVLAGLPTLPAKLSEANSYAERLYAYRVLAKLDNESAKLALIAPAQALGVAWDDDAVATVIAQTEGYSYFIQEYGAAAWEVASASPINKKDVKSAMATAEDNLDKGFFRSRWDRATDAQKQYLSAMAELGGSEVQASAIAKRLSTSTSRLAPRRAELISRGLIYSPKHGAVAFTVPHMANFIKRQSAE